MAVQVKPSIKNSRTVVRETEWDILTVKIHAVHILTGSKSLIRFTQNLHLQSILFPNPCK